jgi:hypothetical protein
MIAALHILNHKTNYPPTRYRALRQIKFELDKRCYPRFPSLADSFVSLQYNNTSPVGGIADSVKPCARIYDEVDAPPTASMCQSGGVEHYLREASVSEVITVGLDIAKHVFHAHGALEACGGAHQRARQFTSLAMKFG